MNDDSLESVLAQLRKGTSTPPTASSKHDDTKHAEQLQHRKAALTPQAEAALIEAASINKSSEMEPMSTMDSSTVLASAQTVPAPSSFQDATMHDYPALQSVDDFMKENPLLPKTRSTPLQAAKASKASEAPGVAKVAKVDPIHLIKFHDTCSKHSIAVSFDYDMPGQTCHSASVQFGERRVEVAGPWTSKKQAKEALCKIAWPQLAELDQQLSSKRKISEAQPSRVGSVGSDVLTSENFVGLLNGKSLMQCTIVFSFSFETDSFFRVRAVQSSQTTALCGDAHRHRPIPIRVHCPYR